MSFCLSSQPTTIWPLEHNLLQWELSTSIGVMSFTHLIYDHQKKTGDEDDILDPLDKIWLRLNNDGKCKWRGLDRSNDILSRLDNAIPATMNQILSQWRKALSKNLSGMPLRDRRYAHTNHGHRTPEGDPGCSCKAHGFRWEAKPDGQAGSAREASGLLVSPTISQWSFVNGNL